MSDRPNEEILVDFLNQGRLPLIGRDGEIAAVVEFWESGADASELRLMVLEGEAGVGKSRIIEGARAEISERGGIVVAIRLRPGTSGSIVQLFAEELRFSSAVAPLLRTEPSGTIDEITGALLRIVRLRPTLLIVEDIHLLEEKELAEFVSLLQRSSRDPVSILATARPLPRPVAEAIRPWLLRKKEVTGLDRQAVATLVQLLFEHPPASEKIDLLRERTSGNPLALRGVLRTLLQRQESPAADFARDVEQAVDAVSAGLAGHLLEAERRDAGLLAALGEIFSQEAAAGVLGEDHESRLESLRFKGIITRTTDSVLRLPSTPASSSLPFAFSHSLLHRRFLETTTIGLREIASVLSGTLPLYTSIPFEVIDALIENREEDIDLDSTLLPLLREAILFAVTLPRQLVNTARWDLGRDLVDVSRNIFEHLPADPEAQLELKLEILQADVIAGLQQTAPHDFERAVDLYVLLADSGDLPDDLQRHRLSALNYLYIRTIRSDFDVERLREIADRIDALVRACPDIRTTPSYIQHLYHRSWQEPVAGDPERVSHILGEARDLQDHPENLDTDAWITARMLYRRIMFTRIESSEDITERLHWIEEGDLPGAIPPIALLRWLAAKHEFYRTIGDIHQTYQMNRRQAREFLQRRLVSPLIVAEMSGVLYSYLLGLPGDRFNEQVDRFLAAENEGMTTSDRTEIMTNLAFTYLLVGDPERAATIHNHLYAEDEASPFSTPFHIALQRKDLSEIERLDGAADSLNWYTDDFGRIAAAILRQKRGSREENTETIELLIALYESIFRTPLLKLSTFFSRRLFLPAFTMIAEEYPQVQERLDASLAESLRETLDWLEERDLSPLIASLIEESRPWLGARELETRERRLTEIVKSNDQRYQRVGTGGSLRIQVLDTITVHGSAEVGSVVPKGNRLRRLIGVLAASQLLRTPLDRREFVRIAAETDDLKKGGHIVKTTVMRAREMIGDASAIDTTGPIPQLRSEGLTVDVVELYTDLKRISEAIDEGRLSQALPRLHHVLDVWNGSVLFPTLYDDFFERFREEFEVRVRGQVLRLTDALRHESDAAAGIDLLRRFLPFVPEDEEVSETLESLLLAGGELVEAGRVHDEQP